MQQIGRGIFYEDKYLGVTLGGLVFTHGVIMIDSPLRAEDARSWRSTLMNQRGGPNRLLVNLDAHPDRTLGDRAFDCTIVAHSKTAQVFRNRPAIFKGHTVETGATWEQYQDAIGMRWAVPDITFSDTLSLHWGGPEILLEHHPGCAPGATWVHIPAEKTIFIGDTVTIAQPPFLAHADVPEWMESLDLLLTTYKNYTLITSRGGLAPVEAVKHMKGFLKKVEAALDRMGKPGDVQAALEKSVPALLKEFDYAESEADTYRSRMRYGLLQLYNRRFRAANPTEPLVTEEEE